MPELRKDPVAQRWVIIATERKLRPSDFVASPAPKKEEEQKFCPFCPGNEDKTPPEIYAVRPDGSAPNGPNWEIRVVANKFPALRIEGNIDRRGVGMFDMMNGIGAHEVVIETPEHHLNIYEYTGDHLAKVIGAFQARSLDLKKDDRFRYVMFFRNYGKEAGASLAHPHTQSIATPVTPVRVKEELLGARDYYEFKERCVFCDIINQETDGGARVVAQNQGFVAVAPFASRFPFEIAVMPLRHNPDFDRINNDERRLLADLLIPVLAKISKGLGDPAYNLVIHTAPSRYAKPGYWQTIDRDFHWHIEIIPWLVRPGGFEWGTGFYINPTPPEEAAQFLREFKI